MEVLTTPSSIFVNAPENCLKFSNNLTHLVSNLNTQLTSLRPSDSEVCQVITYTLIATAVVGLMVYQYIKTQEANV